MAVVSYDKMLNHIPTNNGDGKWKDVEVPLSVFADFFQDLSSLDKNEQFTKYKNLIEYGEASFEPQF